MTFGTRPTLGELGVLRPGKWLPLRSIGWIVVLVFAIMLAFGPAEEAMAHSLPDQEAGQVLAKAVGALIVLAAYTALVRLGEQRWPSELAPPAALAGLLAGLTIGAAMFAVVMTILFQTGAYEITYHGPAAAWRAAGLAIESGVLEEVLVRGAVLRIVWRAFGPTPAFIASSVLFGIGHLGNPSATFFSTACVAVEAGVMLGAFYALTGRLWVSIGVHAGWNFTQGYLFGARVSGGDFGGSLALSTASVNHPTWLTGGAFGPGASIAALTMCLAVGGIVLGFACVRAKADGCRFCREAAQRGWRLLGPKQTLPEVTSDLQARHQPQG